MFIINGTRNMLQHQGMTTSRKTGSHYIQFMTSLRERQISQSHQEIGYEHDLNACTYVIWGCAYEPNDKRYNTSS